MSNEGEKKGLENNNNNKKTLFTMRKVSVFPLKKGGQRTKQPR